MGVQRLAIIDIAAGAQPLSNEDGSVTVACNGEIYNYRELRKQLVGLGHVFRTVSDTETIVHAYEQWGAACVERFRGMFAFAVYDRRSRDMPKLFVARDRLGVKPLYWCHPGDGRFLFASEVRCLLASGLVRPQLDPLATWDYLGHQTVAAPRTLVHGVQLLPPGHTLTADARGTVTEACYWDLIDWARPADPSALPHLRELLEESLALHLVSDVPVGIFLSGGVDSTSIVALVRSAGHVPTTFTLGFSGSAAVLDERAYARLVAKRFGADHTELILTEADLLDQIQEALGAFDHPSGNGVNTYLIAGAVRRAGFKVALSGLGGDEFFAGYPLFRRLERALTVLRALRVMPGSVRATVARAIGWAGGGSATSTKAAAWLASDGSLAELYPVARELFLVAERSALLTKSWRDRLDGVRDPYEDALRQAYARTPGAPLISRISFAEARSYMHDVLLRDTDQMGMAHGLEVRVPLLDHRLVEYLMALPDVVKCRDGRPKQLLVETLADLMPPEIARRRKQGFTLPFDTWLRGPLGSYAREHMTRLGARGILRAGALTELWDRFLSGRRSVTWSQVWALVALEEWLERNGVAA